MNRLQANNGLIFASSVTGLISPDYAVFQPIADVDLNFLTALFRSHHTKAKFRAEAKGLGTGTSGFLRLYTDRFYMIHVALPPKDEQSHIMRMLETELSDLNKSVSVIEREIDLIREYRTRLIADVVTGKVDVRAAAASLPVAVADEAFLDESVLDEAMAEDEEMGADSEDEA